MSFSILNLFTARSTQNDEFERKHRLGTPLRLALRMRLFNVNVCTVELYSRTGRVRGSQRRHQCSRRASYSKQQSHVLLWDPPRTLPA